MKWFKKKEATVLEQEIESVTERLTHIDPASEEYGIVAENLAELQKIENMKKEKREATFEIVKIAVSAATTFGSMIFIANQNHEIMDFEREGTLRSKAWSFNPKIPFPFGGKNKTVNM